jgi:sugar phosphate isomerase/epimerase
MLKWSAGAATLWFAGADLPGWAAAETKIPIGLEMWSVREQAKKELPAVLAAVAKMGFQAVELAHDTYGYDAPAWRKLLDSNGLKACGMHLGLPALEGEQFAKTVAFQKVLGTPYLIIASVPEKNRASVSAIRETCKRFNAISEQLKSHGMKLGYHCHGGDFAKIEGNKTPWELIGENTSPEVIMQLDVGNCMSAGGEPVAMLEEFPGRTLTIHIKHCGGKPGTVVGDPEDQVNWKEVFRICETTGGTKQYVVEEEGGKGAEALKLIARALENMRRMGK